MKFLFNRFKRNLLCLKKAAKESARLVLVTYYVLSAFFVILYMSDGANTYFACEFPIAIFGFTLLFDFIAIIVLYINERSKYKFFSFHKYDGNIIGDNFNDLNKKSFAFSKAMDLLFAHDVKNALDKFISIKDLEITDDEKGVLDFYIGRCYQLMGYFSNASTYYENAVALNFHNDLMDIFNARCYGDMGEYDRSIQLYNEILSEGKNEYKSVIRTDIGRMLLRANMPEKSLEWFEKAVELREDYPNALGGCAIACALLHKFDKGEEYYRKAILNNIPDSQGFTTYYKEVQAVALTEEHPVSSDIS